MSSLNDSELLKYALTLLAGVANSAKGNIAEHILRDDLRTKVDELLRA